MIYLILLAVLAVAIYAYKQSKKDKPSAPDKPAAFFPCVIEGNFTMPDHETRIAARNTSLVNHGHVVTGNDDIDNAVLGGGSPDGGIWLSGSYHFEIDAQGQRIDAASWIKIFSDVQNTVNGGVTGTGQIRMGSDAGVNITGDIVGSTITGKVIERGNDHVHGVMSGTWRATQ